MIDGNKIIDEYEKLPHGEAREAAIKKAIKIADEAGDAEFAFRFRNDLMTENEFHGDSFQSFLVFPELMKIYDDNQSELSWCEYDLIWNFKWVLNDCCDFYQISKEKAYELFDEFKRHCEHSGYSLRSYYKYLYYFEKDIDKKAAKRAYQMFMLSPRDSMSDCRTCELSCQVSYEIDNSSIGRALETAHPILSGELKCSGVPHYTYNNFMLYYLDQGDLEKAEYYRKKCYRLISQKASFLPIIGDMLCLYALTNPTSGVKLFEKHLQWELNSKNMSDKMNFYIGAASLFAHTAKKKTSVKIHTPTDFEFHSDDDIYETKALADYYYKKAYDLCEKFDKRNENDWNVKELEETINQ